MDSLVVEDRATGKGPDLVRISELTRRAAAVVVLCALAVPTLGVAPTSAAPAATLGADVEAVCPPAAPGEAQCLALRVKGKAALPASAALPFGTPGYYGPADIQTAYALPTGNEGTGLTVAVVDAGDLPSAESDLAAYRSRFGLPPCTSANGCFRKVNQTGGTDFSNTPDLGWGLEIALDIEMVSAACPNCKILLVETKTTNYSDLGPAVAKAVALGAIAVSNSYGSAEWSNETYYDRYYNQPGVAVTVATGDCGYDCAGVFGGNVSDNVDYPAASQYVLAVGGTSLRRDSSARGWSESAWGDSYGGAGGGCSLYEPKPSWQADSGCGAFRTQADISAVADPSTGVTVFEGGRWYVGIGGTSAAAPIIAAAAALAGAPAAGSNPASYVYAHAANLNDVVGGNNDVTWGGTANACPVAYPYLCTSVAGYDGPTGLGTPNGTGAFAPPAAPGKPSNLVASSGNGLVTLSWPAPDNGGSPITGYAVTETEAGLGVVPCPMASATSCTVSGLTNGNEYTFTIHDVNVVGSGPESDPSNKAIPAAAPTAPGKPLGVSATGGPASALVSWSAAASNGSPISSYVVSSAPDGKTCTTAGTSCTISGLTNGQPYTFTLTATNGVGTGPASDPSNSVVPAAVPDKPTGASATAGLGSALVSWTAPASNGSPIANYTVTSSPGGKTCSSGGGLSCTVGGLGSGITYSFTVHATNGVGNGPESDPSPAILVFTGATYHALTPGRVLDSRIGLGTGVFHSQTKQSFAVSGLVGVPAGAVAVTGNVTIVGQTRKGYVTIAPSLTSGVPPPTSTINFPVGDTRANGITVSLGAGGKLDAIYWSASKSDTINVIFDVTGYFA